MDEFQSDSRKWIKNNHGSTGASNIIYKKKGALRTQKCAHVHPKNITSGLKFRTRIWNLHCSIPPSLERRSKCADKNERSSFFSSRIWL